MRDKLARWAGFFFLVLLINSAYIGAFASPTIFYMANVLLHLALGIALSIALLFLFRRFPVAGAFFLAASACGIFLAIFGNVRAHRWVLWAHVLAGAGGIAALIPYIRSKSSVAFRRAFGLAIVVLILLPVSTAFYRDTVIKPSSRIRNPNTAPASMEGEGGGPRSPFFPSSAQTNTGGIIPANFFMDSAACGDCHRDIYEQWKSSMHHFASFNNQFYRKSVEYMQDTIGTRPSKWCAGCHDHAMFFNGRFERPAKEQIDTPEARAGLACTSCHAIVHTASSMGNGDFTIEYPPLHELATSKNRYVRALDHFLTYLNPEPHRRTFMKPFMRQDSAEFCSTCHKVHLDVPINHYRWTRGFNDYDNWQASGVSGQGARSFYYPEKPSVCVDCHMPLVPSNDPGNHSGKVHSHRFPGANMAVAYANRDAAQMAVEENFLKSGFISVDIFAVSPIEERPGETAMLRRSEQVPQLMSTFAVGEEAEQSSQAVIREVGKVTAPIDRTGAAVPAGSTVRVDVVVRTRKIGHFFPGGTVDAFDVWLELQARDAAGNIIYWSGCVESDGKGPVERGAHFYRSYLLDAEGNPINKRNAWQARSTLYVRLIPPGAADVAHFRLNIPKNVRGAITVNAKLHYRKFSHYYTQFAYAGVPKPNQSPALLTKDYNRLEYSFDPSNIPKNVSGEIRDEIPNLPIVTVAQAETRLQVGAPSWTPVADKQDPERWNDWGIGLLLQGDLKGAEYAFKKVTEAEPGYADGWLNVARALIQEGETEAAKPYVEKALQINPKLGRTYFFKAMIEKAGGDYGAALRSLFRAESMYPRDRVVLNQIARILFLQRRYAQAIRVLERVCLIDPEDIQMHYTMMLCYRGLGDTEKAAREEKLFRRFKADEASQAITAKPRLISPEDNNERQPIHDHESAVGAAAR